MKSIRNVLLAAGLLASSSTAQIDSLPSNQWPKTDETDTELAILQPQRTTETVKQLGTAKAYTGSEAVTWGSVTISQYYLGLQIIAENELYKKGLMPIEKDDIWGFEWELPLPEDAGT